MGKDTFPKWLAEEISSAKMKKLETLDFTGYVLDINKKDNKADVQCYEQLPDGRQIATLTISEKKILKDLEQEHNKSIDVPKFSFKIIVKKASLSDKAKEYLNENYSITLDNLYSFELESFASLK